MKLKSEDREYLDSLSTRPLALIICSQTYSGKSRFVNELLNEPLLPQSPTINKTDVVRMIRIKVNRSEKKPNASFLFFSIIRPAVSV